MKKILLILFLAMAMIACERLPDKMVSVFENGIEKVQKAKNGQELSDITMEVKTELMNIAQNSPKGNDKMSAEDTRKVLDAQNRFGIAVENKGKSFSY